MMIIDSFFVRRLTIKERASRIMLNMNLLNI